MSNWRLAPLFASQYPLHSYFSPLSPPTDVARAPPIFAIKIKNIFVLISFFLSKENDKEYVIIINYWNPKVEKIKWNVSSGGKIGWDLEEKKSGK